MKKKIVSMMVMVLTVFMLSEVSTSAIDTTLLSVRNKIFEESKEIRSILQTTQDPVLVSSMWDSCIVAMTQLDAYFYMIGIFNTIKKEDLNQDSIRYLTNWLKMIKRTNELNLKSLSTISQPMQPKTKIYVKRLKSYFTELNVMIDAELGNIAAIEKSLQITNR